jgi:hypothetical protein
MSARCECCGADNWFCCRCDETCETGRRLAEGRDELDVEGDPEPALPRGEAIGSSPARRDGGGESDAPGAAEEAP